MSYSIKFSSMALGQFSSNNLSADSNDTIFSS